MAFRVPLLFSFFVKKLTVSGIIGNTHGVNKASSPPIKPRKKIFINELLLFTVVTEFVLHRSKDSLI